MQGGFEVRVLSWWEVERTAGMLFLDARWIVTAVIHLHALLGLILRPCVRARMV